MPSSNPRLAPVIGLPAAWPYLAGLLAVALATALRLRLNGQFDEPALIIYAVPLIFAAWLGGLWSGLAATVFAIVLARIYVLPPVGSLVVTSHSAAGQEATLALTGLSVSLICELLHRQRRSAESAALTQARLAAIVTSSADAIVGKNLDGIITSWNEGSERIFGYTAAEAIGNSIKMLIPPELWQEEDCILERLRQGISVAHYQTTRRHKDGSEILVSLSVAPIRDSQGEVIGASKIARDVTRLRQIEIQSREMQDELAHLARLNAMGQMSAAIAHELNQPLTAIMNYTRASQRLLQQPHGTVPDIARVANTLERIAQQTVRADSTIRYLRNFLEKREVPRSLEDVNAVVVEALAHSPVSYVGNLKPVLTLAPQLQRVEINRIQIQQVLLNLVRNSIEAMTGMAGRELEVSTAPDSAGFIAVTVRDNGPGIAPHILEKLFQPFVTTKEDGMGIGLRVCRSILQSHGGDISLTCSTGSRTEFKLRLPVPDVTSGGVEVRG